MIKGKSAIVTGSTSGIGLAIAQRLASAGVNIMLNGFGDKGEIDKLTEALSTEFSVKSHYSGADITKPQEIEAMIKQAESTFGRLDILVNNAGIQFTALVEEFPPEKWDAILATNLSSVFHGIRYALPGMKKNNFGRIINIASAHGLVASKQKSAYVAAKHGVLGLTKVVALENAERNITCNAICPGWVLTPLVEKQIRDMSIRDKISFEDAKIKLLLEKQPSLRFIKPEDIGDLVIFLCSEAGESMTGAALSMDGGWTAQ